MICLEIFTVLDKNNFAGKVTDQKQLDAIEGFIKFDYYRQKYLSKHEAINSKWNYNNK